MTELGNVERPNFVSARTAAKRVGYSADYVGRLAREGKVVAKKAGRQWLVELDSVKLFTLEVEAEKRRRQNELKLERQQELVLTKLNQARPTKTVHDPDLRRTAVLESLVVVACIGLFMLVGTAAKRGDLTLNDVRRGLGQVEQNFQTAFVFGSITDWQSWWWFVKTEEIVTTEPVATKPTRTEKREYTEPITRTIPQVDARSGEVLVLEPEKDSSNRNREAYVAGAFSDNVVVEFVDTHHGTVTPSFRSGRGDEYPFRLVKALRSGP